MNQANQKIPVSYQTLIEFTVMEMKKILNCWEYYSTNICPLMTTFQVSVQKSQNRSFALIELKIL
jgi:hypothetical protein